MARAQARRVMVACEERLLCETITHALEADGFDVRLLGSPDAEDCAIGLLISTLSTDESIASAVEVIRRHALPWVVVAHTSQEGGREALLEAGALVVLGSETSIAETEAALVTVLQDQSLHD